jgi:hypothetical protein
MACLVSATNAATGEQTGIVLQPPDIRQPPVLVFDNLSELKNTVVKEDYRTRCSGIKNFTGIKNFDIISINTTKLKQQLVSGEKIPIHLDGIPYEIIPRSPNMQRDPQFFGQLVNVSGQVEKNFIVELYVSEPRIKGKIFDPVTDTYYFIDPLFTNQSGKVFYWVYSSKPGLHRDFQIPEDSIFFINGEGKTGSELTPEEVELILRSQQMKNDNQSGIHSYPTTAQPAPLPVTIAITSLGICTGVARYIRRK